MLLRHQSPHFVKCKLGERATRVGERAQMSSNLKTGSPVCLVKVVDVVAHLLPALLNREPLETDADCLVHSAVPPLSPEFADVVLPEMN